MSAGTSSCANLWLIEISSVGIGISVGISIFTAMKRLLCGSMLTGTLLVMQLVVKAQGSTDSLLRELTMAIEKAPAYDEAKVQRIAGLQTALQQYPTASPGILFPFYEQLYDEYQIFQYDSAYEYAGKLHQIAYRLG